MCVHGRSAGGHKKIANIAFPSRQAVFQILESTVRQMNYPMGKFIFLVFLLAVSRMFWQLGKWSAVIAFEEYSNGQLPGKKVGSAYLLP